jgi:apolipoprotein N-acyltransferase
VQRIPRNVRGVAVHDVPMLQGTTVYEVLGDWPGWVALAALVFVGVNARLRKRRGSGA